MWFQSYLSGRTQSIIYNSQYTPCSEVDCSVPQGSVLGPVEFVAYTEDTVDIADEHQVRSHFYADDSQMYDSCRPQDVSGVQDRLPAVRPPCRVDALLAVFNSMQLRRRRFGSVRGGTWIDCMTRIGMSISNRRLFLPSLSFVISACTSTMNYP